MSAQPGTAIVLGYRPQPASAPAGAVVVLEYAPAGAATTVRAGCRAPWAVSRAGSQRTAMRMPATARRDATNPLSWAVAHGQATLSRAPWGVATATDTTAAAPWGEYADHPASAAALPWGVAATADRAAVAPWGRYAGRPAATAAPSWRTAYRSDDVLVVPWGEYRQAARDLVAVVNPAHERGAHWHLPWVRYSRQLNPGWGVVVPDGAPPTDEHGTVIVPVLEYYLVLNEFTCVRADTGEVIDVSAFSANLDADSWCWSWSASLDGALLPRVRAPAPGELVELVATLNGIPLRLAVERIGRDRRFASSQLRISGRGRAAWLDAPYSPVSTRYNTETRTAQQLLADALTLNGVSIGWAVDWQIDDWTVPAGAWSHVGTYKEAATRIAEAGGAHIQAHDTAQTLIVKPRYPLAPWAWMDATPDLVLPEAVCETEGIEWVEKPGYNAVYVVGAAGGRRDRIRRTGTDAANVAPTIVDPLATDPIMTRSRALAVLADTGRQAHISVRLPVLPETGIVCPGTLVRYTESGNPHIGLTRAVSIERNWPELWQTVRIETHVAEPV